MKSQSQNRCTINLLLLLFLSPSFLQFAAGQQPQSDSSPSDDHDYTLDPHVNPSYAVVVIVLVVVFFITGFISVYIHQCTDSSTAVGAPITADGRRNVRGLNQSVIETFPTFLYSEVKESKLGKGLLECAICLSEFEDDESLRLLPKCDHVFHSECIDAWLSGHNTCPVCRANLAVDPIQLGNLAESIREIGSTGEDEVVSGERILSSEVRIEIGEGQGTEKEGNNPNTQERHNQQLTNCVPLSQNMERNNPKTNGKLARSHSTGHSLSRPVDDNSERFTLKLPAEVRRQMLARAKLKRATSLLSLPRASSSRRGYRSVAGEGSGSSRYGGIVGRSISRMVSFRWPAKVRVDGEVTEACKGSTKRGLAPPLLPLDSLSNLPV